MILLMKQPEINSKVDIKYLKAFYSPNLNEIFLNENEEEILKLIISKLDPISKNIFLVYLNENLNIKEASKYFSCSEAVFRNKVNKIKIIVKEEFLKYLGQE